MMRCVWNFMSLVILIVAAQIHPAAAQTRSDGFSDAFFNDVVTPGEMNDLWNRAFDRCEAAGQRPVEDCVIHRDANIVSHGRLTALRCARVADWFARHYCIVIGSIAADLIVKFELGSAEEFIMAHSDNFEHAVDFAGTDIWPYLNQKCAPSDASDGCLLDEISRRLQSRDRDIADCKSNADTHGQADCLIARWVASQVSVAAIAENVGVSGDFFYDHKVKSALNDLASRGQGRCERAGSAVGSDCLIESVATVLPHGKEMTPYCSDIVDFVDRYLCVVTGALAADLYAATGIGTADTFLKDYGRDRERTINQADALVVAFLAGKCPAAMGAPRCGPKEVASRLDSDPKAISLCAFFTEDREDINCLLANRVTKVLLAAEAQL
jgi:hypothetical protein